MPPTKLSASALAKGEADLSRKHFDICQEVSAERLRQNRKFCKGSPIGVQRHHYFTWLTVLVEEVGEVANAMLESIFGQADPKDIRMELIQVAAVAFAMIETIDSNDPALTSPEKKYKNAIRPLRKV
jgi:NTP pyrophosphatase (non-canonical NTP hydrolase)